jgi:hypothetical protein
MISKGTPACFMRIAAKMPDKVKEMAALWQKQTDDTIALAQLTQNEQPRAKAKAAVKKAK